MISAANPGANAVVCVSCLYRGRGDFEQKSVIPFVSRFLSTSILSQKEGKSFFRFVYVLLGGFFLLSVQFQV